MPVEIERKFRVRSDAWRGSVARVRRLRQAYLSKTGKYSLRVRIDDDGATLTVKTAGRSIERLEYEYPIPISDALELIENREGALIVKTRHIVPFGGLNWEVDVFEGDNDGLIIAEIELTSVDADFEKPDWLGLEITHDRRYYNADLAETPYRSWNDQQKRDEVA